MKTLREINPLALSQCLFEEANDALFIFDPISGDVLDANPAAQRMTGHRRSELTGLHLETLILSRNGQVRRILGSMETAALLPATEGFGMTRAGQAPLSVELSFSRLFVSPHPLGVMMARDIAQRKQAESALLENEQRYRMLFERNPMPVLVFDSGNFRFLAVNEAAEKHYGYAEAEFLAKTALHLVPEEDVAEFLRTWEKRPDGINTCELSQTTKDGRHLRVEATSCEIDFAGHRAILCLANDITEKRSLEAQLRQAQKMESIGQLAGGVAHDFNNLLTIIEGNAALLLTATEFGETEKNSATDIAKAARRAANLTRQLLMFSRRQIMRTEVLDLNDNVGQMTKLLQRVLGEDINLKVHYSPRPPIIHADPGMIEQVLMNLVVNARDAMPEGGELVIETGIRSLSFQDLENHSELVPGDYASLRVHDSGCGMDGDTQARIFEPFFTTKQPGKGTGLGLATVYGIVKQHKGWIELDSRPDAGTTFDVLIPISHASPQTESVSEHVEPMHGTECILIVEDDTKVRELNRLVLERYGYRVHTAGNGHQALNLWQTLEGRFDLVLTDIVMPEGMTGIQLGRTLRKLAPDLKIIFSSGYSPDDEGRSAILEGDAFFAKPHRPVDLARVVRDVLDGKRQLRNS